jgi:serine/threonine protein phosphatase 1
MGDVNRSILTVIFKMVVSGFMTWIIRFSAKSLKNSNTTDCFRGNHKGRKFGFVHGHIEQNDWDEFKRELNNFDQAQHIIDHKRAPPEIAMWVVNV